MKTLLALTATILFAASAYAGDFPDIGIEDLKKAIKDKKVVVIDVNGNDSWHKARIPGALNYAAVKDTLGDQLPKEKDTLIVAYCGGPSCKAYKRAAEAAAKLGYTQVKHLSAGISGWLKAGEKTEGGETAPDKTQKTN